MGVRMKSLAIDLTPTVALEVSFSHTALPRSEQRVSELIDDPEFGRFLLFAPALIQNALDAAVYLLSNVLPKIGGGEVRHFVVGYWLNPGCTLELRDLLTPEVLATLDAALCEALAEKWEKIYARERRKARAVPGRATHDEGVDESPRAVQRRDGAQVLPRAFGRVRKAIERRSFPALLEKTAEDAYGSPKDRALIALAIRSLRPPKSAALEAAVVSNDFSGLQTLSAADFEKLDARIEKYFIAKERFNVQ
jgi:hypothetical protein